MPKKTWSARPGLRPISDLRRYLPKEVIERGPSEAELAHAIAHRDHELRRYELLRKVVDCAQLYKYCRRKSCRRKGACDNEYALCFNEFHDELSVEFLPALRAGLRRRREELERMGYDVSSVAPKGASGSMKQGPAP